MRGILQAVTTAAGALVAAAPAAAQYGGGYYGHGGMWEHGWAGMILGPIMMVLVIAAIVAAVIMVVRWLSPGSRSSGGGSTDSDRALDILRERLARGEIDEEEYTRRRRALEE